MPFLLVHFFLLIVIVIRRNTMNSTDAYPLTLKCPASSSSSSQLHFSQPPESRHHAATRARSAAKNFSSKRNAHTHTHAPSVSEWRTRKKFAHMPLPSLPSVRTPKSIDKNTRNSQIFVYVSRLFRFARALPRFHSYCPTVPTKQNSRINSTHADADGALILVEHPEKEASAAAAARRTKRPKRRMQKLANRNLAPRRRRLH